jgi:hypothetical protein
VSTSKVVVHEVEAYRVSMELDLFRETIGQSCEAAHPHSHRQVLAFDVGGRDSLGVRVTGDDSHVNAGARRSAIGTLR